MNDDYSADDQGPKYKREDLDRIGQHWLSRIAASELREKDWTDTAERAEAIYLCNNTEGQAPQFNILFSNVETIVPSIYNSTPRPEIRARHGNMEDPIAKKVSDIYERAIEVQIDDSRMDVEIEMGAQDAYTAGRSIVRVKFDADEMEQEPQPQINEMTGQPDFDFETGELVLVDQDPIATNEVILFENVSWRDYRQGPAKRWRDVPWVAYRHEVSTEEKNRLESVEISDAYKTDKDYKDESFDEDLDCTIWEIWCKDKMEVLYIVADSGKVLDIKEDPLGLTGFFPQPAPVQPITPTGKLTPVCPYSAYEALAKELDTTTRRINAIVKGLKVRGAIAGDAADISEIAAAGDNELVAVANLEGLIAAGGLSKAVMWWPIDMAIQVLRELYVQRDQTKAAIYEITGISDIVRGQSQASETATAQQIKTQWGSLRIKKMQRGIERQVRELFVMSAEIISQHFSHETLQKLTGIQIDEQIQQKLQKPLDHYRINVESDSTVRADLTKSRGEMSEFLQGTAQFFGTMQPIVQAAPEAAAPLAKMYAAFAQQFNLGKSAEDALEQFVKMAEQASQQPQGEEKPDPEVQMKMQEMQMKMKEVEAKMKLEVSKLQLQAQNLQIDKQIKGAELQIKGQELGIKQNQFELSERSAEFDAVAKSVEIDMEMDQERPVKLG